MVFITIFHRHLGNRIFMIYLLYQVFNHPSTVGINKHNMDVLIWIASPVIFVCLECEKENLSETSKKLLKIGRVPKRNIHPPTMDFQKIWLGLLVSERVLKLGKSISSFDS